jgi:hypothetical protein
VIVLLPVLLLPVLLLSRRGRKVLKFTRTFLAGHPVDGQLRTNATFTRGATRVLHPTGRAHGWWWLAGWQRGAVKLTVILAVVTLAWGVLFHRTGTAWALAIPAAAGIRYGAWRLYRRPTARHRAGLVRRWWPASLDWRDLRRNRRKFAEDTWAAIRRPWVHYWHFYRPSRHALTGKLGAPPPRLEIEPDRSRVVVGVPVEFTGDDKEKAAVERAATAKLAIPDAEPSWRLHGRKPCLTLVRAFPPPQKLGLAPILPDIRAAKWHEIVWGIGKRDERVITSWKGEAPFTGLSMRTGLGKSETSGSGLAQACFHGALGVVLDVKMFSHQWAKGLPNVAYARTPAEVYAMLLWLEGEVRRRNDVADAEGGVDEHGNLIADVGPPLFVIFEELPAMQGRIAKYYRLEIKPKLERPAPARAPAIDALDEFLFTARQVLGAGLLVAQRLSVKATSGAGGNGDARENVGNYLMCDPSLSAMKMTGWDNPLPPAAAHKGRIQLVTPTGVRELQAVLMTPEEKRWLATAGKVAEPRWDMPLIGRHVPNVPTSDRPAIDAGQGSDCPISAPPPPPPGITVAEAVEAGLFGHAKVATVVKRLQRDPGAPSPIVRGHRGGPAHRYDENDLHEYAAK